MQAKISSWKALQKSFGYGDIFVIEQIIYNATNKIGLILLQIFTSMKIKINTFLI